MKSLFDDLLSELIAAPSQDFAHMPSRVRMRVGMLAESDRSLLVEEAIARSRRASESESGWIPERTLAGLILHSVGVPTISSPEEEQLRRQISETLDAGRPNEVTST